MSRRQPAVTGAQVVRALERAGFKIERVHGSHHMMRHPDGRVTSVPVHGHKTLRVGTFAKILKNVNMTADDFAALF